MSNRASVHWTGYRYVLLAIIAGGLVATCARAALAPPPAHADGLPALVIPECLGVDIHFADPRPGEMRMLAACGFHWVRRDLGWSGTERAKERYDFSAYDKLLAALNRYHMRWMAILCYGNPLYQHGQGPSTPAARHAFCRWVAAAVKHFKGHGIMWEMWNEPNGGTWVPHDAQAYAKLAVAVGKTIRRVAPHELYVGPALSGVGSETRNFLEGCFRGGVLKYFDALTVHPYRDGAPESVMADYQWLRGLVSTYNRGRREIPIIAGEWGYSNTWFPHDSDAKQACYAVRALLTDLYQRIPLTIWYDWHDDGTNPHNQEDNFGLIRFAYHAGHAPVYTPKPSYVAIRTLSTVLNGRHFAQRIKVGSRKNFVLRFIGPKGPRIAAWTTASKPRMVTVPLPAGSYVLINEMGAKTRRLLVPADAPGLHLTISQRPEYLTSQD